MKWSPELATPKERELEEAQETRAKDIADNLLGKIVDDHALENKAKRAKKEKPGAQILETLQQEQRMHRAVDKIDWEKKVADAKASTHAEFGAMQEEDKKKFEQIRADIHKDFEQDRDRELKAKQLQNTMGDQLAETLMPKMTVEEKGAIDIEGTNVIHELKQIGWWDSIKRGIKNYFTEPAPPSLLRATKRIAIDKVEEGIEKEVKRRAKTGELRD